KSTAALLAFRPSRQPQRHTTDQQQQQQQQAGKRASKKAKTPQKTKGERAALQQAARQQPKLQQKTKLQNAHQKEILPRKKAKKQEEETAADSDTIKISSDEEQTPAKTNNAGDIYTLDCNVASFEQRNRCGTPSRSPCDNSSSSSAISSSLRSLDYEAEADEEDANECEGVELQRKLAGGNDNLMHVQNFLNYFDGQQQQQQQRQQRRQKTPAICYVTHLQQEMLRQQEGHNVDNYMAMSSTEAKRLNTYVEQRAVDELLTPQQQLDFMSPTTNMTATTALTTTTSTTTSTAKASSKPGKFTISTKFLRKPRHKLKSVNLAPTADVSGALAKATTTIGGDKQLALHDQQQSNDNNQLLLQQEQRQQPPCADEPNVKFNSNFSINSLLNKK
ncbi:myb-like protein AA, partial [Bactrocera neohumeralis]|uniref:myb-like protein AA n=1 Tax=Bactrocera neohumeralis TaxID=98809 RepID=UPI002166612D